MVNNFLDASMPHLVDILMLLCFEGREIKSDVDSRSDASIYVTRQEATILMTRTGIENIQDLHS